MYTYMKKMRARNEEGFTLTEMIVVIVIIGTLAAIAVNISSKNREKALDLSVENELNNIALKVNGDISENNHKILPPAYLDTLKQHISSSVKDPDIKINAERPNVSTNTICLFATRVNNDGASNKGKTFAITFPDSSAIIETAGPAAICGS